MQLYYPDFLQYVHYHYHPISKNRTPYKQQSIQPLGIDTEAYVNGRCFMVATSEGDAYHYADYPQCLFNRKYKNSTFVAYNLAYDEGALLQFLPKSKLVILRETGVLSYNNYTIKYIPKKFLRITQNKKDSITIYDMMNFYQHSGDKGSSSLDSVAYKYLGERKIEVTTKRFTTVIVRNQWEKIAKYCIQDALLTKKLALLIISMFEEFGVYPRALYSTAYITYQYFSKKTDYVTVHRFWRDHRKVLSYAMASFNGGKFEVTRKGCGHYYEYDIVSAYPYEIANLIDISHARVIYDRRLRTDADYGFLYCTMNVPLNAFSPVAWKWGSVNIYPVGIFSRVITLNEYYYLISVKARIVIMDAVYLICDTKKKPYNDEIRKLFAYKKKYKEEGNYLKTHTVKILLNSLYGKFVQVIRNKKVWSTSTCWNPIYGSIITSNVRIRISQMQQKYQSVVAVHTDSVISTKPLPLELSTELGGWSFECEGDGVILGSGIYQIGETSKIRGFHTSTKLLDMINKRSADIQLTSTRALSWREVIFHGWNVDRINRFEDITKKISINFDKKRLWINDYALFSDIKRRVVHSIPHVLGRFEV